MMKPLHYQCTALVGVNKAGVLKPDEKGCYTVVLGALEFYNSIRAYYTLTPFVKNLFESESSSLIRRINKAVCFGEYGHPKKAYDEPMRDYLTRVMTIEETRVSHIITEVWIDYESVKTPDGKPCVAIMGKIKPTGPYGEVLKKQIEDGVINVCFSIRSFTNDNYVRGTLHKELKMIITWDYVGEGGLEPAQKYLTPGLENYDEKNEKIDLGDGEVIAVSHNLIESLGKDPKNLSLESDARGLIEELKSHFNTQLISSLQAPPKSSDW